jgi:hypothetical protein
MFHLSFSRQYFYIFLLWWLSGKGKKSKGHFITHKIAIQLFINDRKIYFFV